MSKYNELVNVVNELHDTLHKIKAEHEQLREILRPAIDAANDLKRRQHLGILSRHLTREEIRSLLRAGEVLGFE